jgi:hypothetical protein
MIVVFPVLYGMSDSSNIVKLISLFLCSFPSQTSATFLVFHTADIKGEGKVVPVLN